MRFLLGDQDDVATVGAANHGQPFVRPIKIKGGDELVVEFGHGDGKAACEGLHHDITGTLVSRHIVDGLPIGGKLQSVANGWGR